LRVTNASAITKTVMEYKTLNGKQQGFLMNFSTRAKREDLLAILDKYSGNDSKREKTNLS
jgi:hypothetical protein